MGMQYIDSTGHERPARTLREPCPKNCAYQCSLNFTLTERNEIHQKFWKLNRNEKCQYYAEYVQRIEAKRKRVKHESRRLYSFRYYFEFHDRRLQVCQGFFLKTLDLNKNSIYHYFKTNK